MPLVNRRLYYFCFVMDIKSLWVRIYKWRLRRITDRQFILILSVVVGFAGGLAAVIIKSMVRWIQQLLISHFPSDMQNYFYFLFPLAGIFLTVLFVRYLLRDTVGHGIPTVLYSISRNNGIIKRHNMFSSIVSSVLTVGFGGSVGLEGPTVATGAAIGSNLGRLFRLNYRQIILLLGCASTAAMASIFKAPIAAIVFSLEVIMLDLTMASLIPLLISSVTAVLISYAFLGQNVLYPFDIHEKFMVNDVPWFIIMGIFAGLVSVYFTRMYMLITSRFEMIHSWMKRLLFGGLGLGVLIFLVPSLYGEGYEAINNSLNGDYSHLFDNTFYHSFHDSLPAVILGFLVIILFKAAATSLTFSAGGVGGMFAPTLFLGANSGLFFAKILNLFNAQVSESNFALVGMAGMLSGIIHAPLTAIFLIAEVTGGYELFIPLMIVATISFATVRIFETNSVYTIQLARRGELMTHDKDKAALSLMQVSHLIETNFNTIHPDATLGELVQVISRSQRNIFPVVDEENNLMGIVFVNDIRHIVFNPELYDNTYVRDLMFMPTPIVHPEESMEEVAHKFETTQHYNLPVIDNGKYVGFVSRANVFSRYRQLIRDFSDD